MAARHLSCFVSYILWKTVLIKLALWTCDLSSTSLYSIICAFIISSPSIRSSIYSPKGLGPSYSVNYLSSQWNYPWLQLISLRWSDHSSLYFDLTLHCSQVFQIASIIWSSCLSWLAFTLGHLQRPSDLFSYPRLFQAHHTSWTRVLAPLPTIYPWHGMVKLGCLEEVPVEIWAQTPGGPHFPQSCDPKDAFAFLI